jgi:hypothetical protein
MRRKYIRNILNESLNIFENIQLAKKIYFDTNKLDEHEKDLIINVEIGRASCRERV